MSPVYTSGPLSVVLPVPSLLLPPSHYSFFFFCTRGFFLADREGAGAFRFGGLDAEEAGTVPSPPLPSLEADVEGETRLSP